MGWIKFGNRYEASWNDYWKHLMMAGMVGCPKCHRHILYKESFWDDAEYMFDITQDTHKAGKKHGNGCDAILILVNVPEQYAQSRK